MAGSTLVPKSGRGAATESITKTDKVALKKSDGDLPEKELDFKDLPSRGLAYPNGGVISYFPYTFGETNKFSQSGMGVKSRIEFVLKGIKSSFGNKKLTLPDMVFISLYRKLVSFGAQKFTVSPECICGNTTTKQFDFGDLEFIDLEVPKLPLVVTIGGVELHFSPLTIEGYFELIDEDKVRDKTYTLAKQVINVDFDRALKTIEAATGADSEVLEEITVMLFHDMKPLRVKCKGKITIKEDNEGVEVDCEEVINVALENHNTLITPFRESKDAPRNRIQFGL